MGAAVPRLRAEDPEVSSLLSAPVPIVVTGSGLAGQAVGREMPMASREATEKWTFEYLEQGAELLSVEWREAVPGGRGQLLRAVLTRRGHPRHAACGAFAWIS